MILLLISASISGTPRNWNLRTDSSRRGRQLVTTFQNFSRRGLVWKSLCLPISNLRWPYSASYCPRTSWSTNAEVPSGIFLSFSLTVVKLLEKFSQFLNVQWSSSRKWKSTHLAFTVSSSPESLATLTVPDASPNGFPPTLGVSPSSFAWNLGRSLKKQNAGNHQMKNHFLPPADAEIGTRAILTYHRWSKKITWFSPIA